MTGATQVFLLAFGAALAVIGVVIFFLLAWFKEATGQQDVVKILQAEFRLSNPGLVIFIGGLGLMVVPFFLGQGQSAATPPEPAPTPTVAPAPTFTPTLESSGGEAASQFPPLPLEKGSTITPVDISTPPAPTFTPQPTATPEPPAPTPLPTATPVPAPADIAGRWSNLGGYVEFYLNSPGAYDFESYDSVGTLLGEGTASFDGYTIALFGTDSFLQPFSGVLYLTNSNSIQGTLYDTFGYPLVYVTMTR